MATTQVIQFQAPMQQNANTQGPNTQSVFHLLYLIMEQQAHDEEANGVNDTILRGGYGINLRLFVGKWTPVHPLLRDLARSAFLNVRIQPTNAAAIYCHDSFSHPHPWTPIPLYVDIIPSFEFARRIQLDISSASRQDTANILHKASTVCNELIELHIVLRGIDDNGGNPLLAREQVLNDTHSWLQTAETSLRAAPTRVKTLDVAPAQGRYSSSPFRAVRLGSFDTRLYLQQVQPRHLHLNEFTFTGIRPLFCNLEGH